MTLEEMTEYIMRRACALGILQQRRGVIIYLDVPGGCGITMLISRILQFCGMERSCQAPYGIIMKI